MEAVFYPSVQLLTDAYQILEAGDKYTFFKFCRSNKIENEDIERIFCRFERFYRTDLAKLRKELVM